MSREVRAPTATGVKTRYRGLAEVWPVEDRWHRCTHERLREATERLCKRQVGDESLILDVGAGNSPYELGRAPIIHLDIIEKFLPRDGLAVVANAERLPLAASTIDLALCVGSVLNYCDPVAVVSELARVVVKGGFVLLEFESSTSAEYIGRSEFGELSVLVQTRYQGFPENIWLYRPSFIRDMLAASGLRLLRDEGIQALTVLAYRVLQSEAAALSLAAIDRSAVFSRLCRGLACNRLFFAQKES